MAYDAPVPYSYDFPMPCMHIEPFPHNMKYLIQNARKVASQYRSNGTQLNTNKSGQYQYSSVQGFLLTYHGTG